MTTDLYPNIDGDGYYFAAPMQQYPPTQEYSLPQEYPGTEQYAWDGVSSVGSPQSVYSNNSTSTGTSSVGSYFSQASAGTHLTRPPNPAFAGTEPTPYPPANNLLPCEFAIYSQCGLLFDPTQEDEWIIHHAADHLKGVLPKRLRCPLCDEFPFDYRGVEKDKETNFWNRMRHCASHYTSGEPVGPMRVDHFMAHHLRENGMIGPAEFASYMGQSEVRSDVRQAIARGARPHDFVPPRERDQRRRDNRVEVRPDAEDRRRRRSNR